MNNEKLRKMQLIQVDMLDEVVRICKKYNLTYYLYYGTLLGAVRHKGFIPWDDDMDIVMPRKNYDTFCRVAQIELSKDYFLQTEQTDSNYPCAIARIRRNGTIYKVRFMERQNYKHYGCWIDIYPMDNVTSKYSPLFWFQATINREVIDRLANYRAIKLLDGLTMGKRLFYYLSFIQPLSRWVKLRNEIYRLNKNDETKYFINFTSPYSVKKDLMIKDAFNPPKQLEFEGKFYSVPNDWNYVLHQIYGDYMKLPPEEKRCLTHYPVEWKL